MWKVCSDSDCVGKDNEIDEIGLGVDELGEIARAANEEVREQGVMLETLEMKMDDVHDKVLHVNEKMSLTLEEVRQLVYLSKTAFLQSMELFIVYSLTLPNLLV